MNPFVAVPIMLTALLLTLLGVLVTTEAQSWRATKWGLVLLLVGAIIAIVTTCLAIQYVQDVGFPIIPIERFK